MFKPGDAGTDFDAVIAKMIALAARNDVEDLHAEGAFSDRQAPALNRLLRGRIYELLLAMRRGVPSRNDDPLSNYINALADGNKGGRAVAALQGAVGRAIEDFAAAEGIDPATTERLRNEAIKGAVEAHKTATRLSLGRSKDEEKDSFAVAFWLQSIPDYWEEPEVSPG
jgi:hypothetical protein